jgi:hypothetical protein
MELSETQQRELARRLAQGVIDATSNGVEVTRDFHALWAITNRERDEIRMCALFLAEMLEGDQS